MKRTATVIALLVPFVALSVSAPASALSTTVSAGASSAAANNSSAITFTITESGVSEPQNGYPAGCDEFQPYAGGSGNTFSAETLELSYTGGGNCTGTFTLKSSVAETKTVGVNVKAGKDNYQPTGNTVNVTFTAVSTPTTTTPKPPIPTTTTPEPTPTPPDAPTTRIKLNNQAVTTATTPTIQAGKGITLSGTTIPNGVVTLYIFSTPRQVTTTADAQGNWSYEVTSLESGSHHVEAVVTDPATKLTSDRVTLATFSVARPATVATTKTVDKKATPLWVWIVAGIGVAGAVAGAVFWWLRRRGHDDVTPPTPPSANEAGPTQPQPPVE